MDTLRELEQFALRQRNRAESAEEAAALAEEAAVHRHRSLLSIEEELNVTNLYMSRAYGSEAV